MQEAELGAGPVVRLRTFGLVTFPLVMPILFTVFWVPSRHESSLDDVAQRKAEVLVSIFAENAAPKVHFEDDKGLQELLASAGRDPDFMYAMVFAKDGRVLAQEGAANRINKNLEGLRGFQLWPDSGALHAVHPITRANETLGAIQLGFSQERSIKDAASFRNWALVLSLSVLALAAGIAIILGKNFARVFEQLRRSLSKTARQLDDVVSHLSAVTAQQTAAAAEQSSALHETNTTAYNVGQSASAAAQRASALIEGGSRAEAGAEAGAEAANSATTAMREVREQMSTIATSIGALSERAAAIGEIAATVALLAERSNLLALNAAIEAAKAGAQGRGFSVVAQEMRSLADGSNRSAGQVKSIISEIQASIIRAVNEAREGERRGQNAERLGETAGQSIRRFADATREFAAMGKEIASAANQQSASIEQMVESIGHATQAGSSQLESTKQTEETARQLRQLSRELLAALAGKESREDFEQRPPRPLGGLSATRWGEGAATPSGGARAGGTSSQG